MLFPFQGEGIGAPGYTQGVASLALGYVLVGLSARFGVRRGVCG